MKNRPIRILILIAAMFMVLPFAVKATPPDPGTDPGIPIDGGASLLVGAAVVYGVKKYKDRKQAKELNK